MYDFSSAAAALREATRPRSSGQTVNVHVVQSVRVIPPDYEKMRDQIEIMGERGQKVDEASKS
jgi:hypothetical protein